MLSLFKNHLRFVSIILCTLLLGAAVYSSGIISMESAHASTTYQDFFDKYGETNGALDTTTNLNKYPTIYKQLTQNTQGQDLAPELVIRNSILFVLDILVWVITAIAVLFIILAGVKMVIDQNGEEAVKKQFTVIRDIAIGMVVMHSARFFVANIYSDPTSNNDAITAATNIPCTAAEIQGKLCYTASPNLYVHMTPVSDPTFVVNFRDATSPILVSEKVVYPLLNYFFGFVAAFAILFIIISTFRIITAQGDPEKIKSAREGLINTALGLVVMMMGQYFVKAVYGLPTSSNPRLGPDVAYGISLLMNIANYMLGFMSFIAVVMLIYAGVLIVSSGVTPDNKKKGYGIVRRVVMGIIIVISSYAVISTIARLAM
ncbi:MAG: hypothetical protein ACK4NC_03785 [Candidatus Gracilibacteria bacterium]